MKLLVFLAALAVTVQTAGAVGAARAATCVSDEREYVCETTTFQVIEYEPLYDNGLSGALDLENLTPLHVEWPSTLDGQDIPDGAVYEPAYRAGALVYAALNGTAQPNASNTAYFREINSSTGYGGLSNESNLTAVLQYAVNFSASIIMSGSSEFYYASPLPWVPANYSAHYIQIHDEDGAFVTGARYPPTSTTVLGNTFTNSMGSTLHNGTVYYRLSAPIESEHTYTVTEYVETTGSPPLGLPNVAVFLAPGQDIDSDGNRTTRFFPGSSVERVVDEEVAYSFRFVHGMSPGGAWKKLQASPSATMYLFSAGLPVENLGAAGSHLSVLIPIQSSVPYDVSVNVWGDGWSVSSGTLEDVTGSVNLQLPISGTVDYSDAAQTVEVDWWISLEEVPGTCESADFEECAALAYPIYQEYGPDGLPIGHVANTTEGDYYASDYSPFIELSTTNASGGDVSTRGNSALQAAAVILAGAVVIAAAIVVAPVSIPLAVAGVVVGTALIAGSAIVMDEATRQALLNAIHEGKDILTLAACGGMFVLPGIGLKLTAGAACALLGMSDLYGGLPGLVRLVLELAEFVTEVVEKVGMFLAWMLEYGWIILLVVGIFLSPYLFFIMIKYPLLMILGPIAGLLGYQRVSKWPLFDRVYNYYMFGWTELVENRLLKMGVKR